MIYVENPTVRGTIEEHLAAVGNLADDNDALYTLGSDPIALSLLEQPVDVGADVVVGDASVLGLPTSYGMGLGLFATREDYLRQVPGRLVGVSEDATDRRAFTLTLQTREQHIRRERATSNICTNQAWVALRTAMHAAVLGSTGMVDLAKRDVIRARDLAERLDDIVGVKAPVHDRHHVREFVARVDQPARAVAEDLERLGFAVHVLGDHEIQLCIAGVSDDRIDRFVEAPRGGDTMSDDRDAAQSRYDQARYVKNGEYEPLLSEKDQTRVEIGASGDDGNGAGSEDIGSPLPDDLTRDSLELPELSEPELARHYTRLSQMIYGIDSGPYPLGSCTMKYNPKFTEDVAALPSAAVHPDRSEESVQGTLELLYRLQDYLGRIGGMDAVTLQPPAGAAGEFVGIRVAAAYHEHNDEGHRDEVIIPESAHGTNFASAALGGYDVVSPAQRRRGTGRPRGARGRSLRAHRGAHAD